MKYMCLRTCYTGERLYHKGGVYELPDEMRKSEKSFRLVGAEAPAQNTEKVITEAAIPVTDDEAEQALPLAGETVEVAPLYLSDKPKPKRKRAVKKNG